MKKDELIRRVSLMLAAAYWRGRYAEAKGENGIDSESEATIARVAENDRERWIAAATFACEEATGPGYRFPESVMFVARGNRATDPPQRQ